VNNVNRSVSTAKLLRYKKGEQIFKQNDFGISIYKIINGKVLVFRECEGLEVPIAQLGKGNIIGEMIFLLKGVEVRSASARALEDSEIEVTHPKQLLEEYEASAPILKLMAETALNRLVRMNTFLDRLAVIEQVKREHFKAGLHFRKNKRRFYRKKVNLACKYALRKAPRGCDVTLKGSIKDISMSGLRLEIPSMNERVMSHEIGEVFQVETVLPNEKQLKLICTLVRSSKARGCIDLGMTYAQLNEGTRKTLGFFLLPA
jgi:CRP-like cAMP-binding protein